MLRIDATTFALVAGTGAIDNASFSIVGNELRTAAAFNFEVKSSYSVRVRATDAGGNQYERAYTVGVTNVNEAPTALNLSAVAVAENLPSGSAVGTLSATDPDAGAAFTFALVAGLIMHSAMNGPQGAFIAELFPTRIRYSGASLCYQVTPIIGGSWAPVISLAIFRQFHSTGPISLYLAGSCAVSCACALLARETKGLTFDEIDARGA